MTKKYFLIITVIIVLISVAAVIFYKAFVEKEPLELPPGTMALTHFEKPYTLEKVALPISSDCPEKNFLPTPSTQECSSLLSVNSKEGYANVRSDGLFSGDNTGNILATIADKQEFCGGGPVKPAYTEGNTPLESHDLIGPLAYTIFLKDPKGQYCKGYISYGLVKS
jgi:hypothetical protein